MFPLVPYHNLPKLHELVKADMPRPTTACWRRGARSSRPCSGRRKTPPTTSNASCPRRPSAPMTAQPTAHIFTAKGQPVVDGWVEICASQLLQSEDVIRFDHDRQDLRHLPHRRRQLLRHRRPLHARQRPPGRRPGHGHAHRMRQAQRALRHHRRLAAAPAGLRGAQDLQGARARRQDLPRPHLGRRVRRRSSRRPPTRFRVVSNDNVATFIKELVLEPEPGSPLPDYQPGDYLQFDIPAYERAFVAAKSTSSRRSPRSGRRSTSSTSRPATRCPCRRNYSLADQPGRGQATALQRPHSHAAARHGLPCRASARPTSSASSRATRSPPSARSASSTSRLRSAEMVYLGGGAGMAPLRSHLSHLFETRKRQAPRQLLVRRALAAGDVLPGLLRDLARQHPNFSFHLALSEPQPEDNWRRTPGFIHDVLQRRVPGQTPRSPRQIEYYLCGPPAMVQAARVMLAELGVDPAQIAFDEF